MVGIGDKDRGQSVERDLAIRLRVLDRCRIGCLVELQMIGMMMHRPRRVAAKDVGVERRIGKPAALEDRANRRMGLETLELLERAEEGVAIIEPDDEADGDLIVLEMIEKRAAIGRFVQRPSDRVGDETWPMLRRLDLPQLLDADAEGLWIDPGAQVKALEQHLRQRAAAAFGEQYLLAD